MDDRDPRLSRPTLGVLTTLLGSPRDELSGAEIGKEANIGAGTLYPVLARLEKAGWLTSRWETEDPHALGRPRRRYYRVTPLGATKAKAALRQFEPAIRRLAWES
ncbi:MAG: PadR family transcriptional regulator [Alphaproteobacteria bacterium]|nr:PadR family transcriptional regulator [Alphaproteobacteria bacterium]